LRILRGVRTLSVPTTVSTLFFEAHSGSARPTPTLEANGPCGISLCRFFADRRGYEASAASCT